MMTNSDIERLQFPYLTKDEIRRITNVERTCKVATTEWSKKYWYGVFKELCTMYGVQSYFRKVIN